MSEPREMYLPGRHVAKVFRGERFLGTLTRQFRGASFQYDPEFLDRSPGPKEGIAYAMPPTLEPYEARGINVHPFFANLLPEGDLLPNLARRLKTSKDDLLTVLVALGSDTIGDVRLSWEDDALPSPNPVRFDPATTSFAEMFEARYGTAHPHSVALSGAQPKMSAARIAFPATIASRGECLLKLSFDPRFPSAAENEHYFMDMAAKCGIKAAKTEIVKDRDGVSALLVRRFDRLREKRTTRRLHQEDGCQVLDLYPADKYAVSTETLISALASVSSAPRVVALEALAIVAFSYAIGNHDLHAKNLSVLEGALGLVTLSPAYDLISTLAYGDPQMALPLNGKRLELTRADFLAAAAALSVPERAMASRLEALAIAGESAIAAMPVLDLPMAHAAIREGITRRFRLLRAT